MNERIKEAIDLTKQVLADARRGGQNVNCSVSGGADSDILIDLCERTEPHYVKFSWFDTGIEYQTTKEHLEYLEAKYNIAIDRIKAKVPVPLGNQKYGKPFLNKQVSEYIHCLQLHDFKWEDRPFEELILEYPRCNQALRWWCNEMGEKSAFNISRSTWLKEFLVKNPPPFAVSPRCCEGAKKKPAESRIKDGDFAINIVGIRKAEQGVRTFTHKEMLHSKGTHTDFYPILNFTDADRKEYEQEFGIQHSKCYTEYGLSRTGCVGCPFGRQFSFERDVAKQHEPKLYRAIERMWGDVYDYTDKYREFQRFMNLKYKSKKQCVCGCTEFTGDDVAMNLKYFGRDVKTLLCKGCFQNIMEMSDEQWDEAIEGFKAQGCQLF